MSLLFVYEQNHIHRVSVCFFFIPGKFTLCNVFNHSLNSLIWNYRAAVVVVVVVVLSRVSLMQIVLCCDVAVLNLSVRMSRGAAREPLARLLLITRLLPSSDMSSSDVASRWDGATEPHRLVCVHKNQTHLFVNTVVSHAAVSQKGSSCWSSQPSSPLLPLTTIADCHRTR